MNSAHESPRVTVVGAGLAGSEAAWQAARAGCEVTLIEMRPVRMTPAHQTDRFAELVCSNSLRGASLENAVGLLKEEMRRLASVIMAAADATQVPAGGALAVDRDAFPAAVTERVTNHPHIRVERREVHALDELPEDTPTVIATGPLTAPDLSESIRAFFGSEYLAFYDAAAPIVAAESIDMDKVFRASRYGKGEEAYLNCPMSKEEYERFWHELVHAELAPLHDFELGPGGKPKYFEGCLPVEEIARRGPDTLRYGPLKPVGLDDPRTGRRPYAVVQLRQDNAAATHYNIVGFQTNLRWPEQKRVFSLIPGLEQAEFVRYGVMHRNSFISSPVLLQPTLQTKGLPRLFFAGQMIGVEGYVESAAAGLVAGRNAARLARGEAPLVFPPTTMIGALCRYVTKADPKYFQPMNAAFGLFPPLEAPPRNKRERNRAYSARALAALAQFSP